MLSCTVSDVNTATVERKATVAKIPRLCRLMQEERNELLPLVVISPPPFTASYAWLVLRLIFVIVLSVNPRKFPLLMMDGLGLSPL